jgi:hypothetical protein
MWELQNENLSAIYLMINYPSIFVGHGTTMFEKKRTFVETKRLT